MARRLTTPRTRRRGAQIDPQDVRLFSGSSHPELAAGIGAHLHVPLEQTRIAHFSNDDLFIQLGASVRSRTVFIVQSLTPPASDHVLELLMMLDAARGAAAREVHAIIPYFSYARSDKKDAPRISITARLIADLLETAGATHVMTMNLHSPQVHGFFRMPTDPLTARPLFAQHFHRRKLENAIVIAPDAGIAKSAARFAAALGLPSVAAEKMRLSDTRVEIDDLLAKQVRGFKRALVYDDEIATGSTMLEVCRLLVKQGVERISLVCTHGLFTGDAIGKLSSLAQVDEIVTTDTVPIPAEKRVPQLKILSVAPVFGEAIRRNFCKESIGDLFAFGDAA
ncbi:MAG: ribose-phosphate pyrophosphokinase [Anaerolineales bacterium]|nr:ribose-phosphate pyrophosphokinase [Anaerolineales bacterium]